MNIIELPKEELLRLFNQGWSTNKLSKYYSISRGCIDKNLVKYGVAPRNQTEANRLSMSQRTKEENIRNAFKANEAIRARKFLPNYKEIITPQRIKQAKTREKLDYLKGYGEDELFNYLYNKNYDVVAQKAFDIYNIDIMLNDNIAIELTTLNNPYRFEKNAEKTKLLIKNGYKVIWLTLPNKESIYNNLENIETIINRKDLAEVEIFRCTCIEFEKYRNEKGQFDSRPIKPKYLVYPNNHFSF